MTEWVDPAAPRPGPATTLMVIGSCCVVLGGLIAAVSGPLDMDSSWVVAYLVLVGGAAQFAMGYARTWRLDAPQPRSWGWVQTGGWNLGNAVVIGATLTGEPLAVDLGSALLVVALGIAMHAA